MRYDCIPLIIKKFKSALAATEAHLQECLHEDPLMLTIHPATKGWMLGSDSFDDRSFLKIKNYPVSRQSNS